MKVTIKVSTYDVVEINIPVIMQEECADNNCDKYHSYADPKWKKFCRDHNFDSRKPWGKVYDLYLRMCAEGML